MDVSAEILTRLARMEDILRTLRPRKEPGLTVAEFARRVKHSRSTIYKMLDAGELHKRGGRIPAELLSRFLS